MSITPLLPLGGSNILLKLEGFQPTGSMKDRIIFPMLQTADKEKPLLVEDWGPFALSAAWACRSTGRELLCLLPEDGPDCFAEQIRALGVAVVHDKRQIDEAVYQRLDQWMDPEHPMAYCESLAEELWQQTDGNLAAVVCGTETCGCLMGCATGLKMKNPDVLAVGAPIHRDFYGNCDPLGKADPEFYVPQLSDLLSYCSPESACEQQERLFIETGIHCGIIGGAALQAARELEKELFGPIVAILPSRYGCY